MNQRVDVHVQVGQEPAVAMTFTYNGGSLGRLIDAQPSDLQMVKVFGRGRTDYDDIEPVLAELIVRMISVSRVLDKHTDPHIVMKSENILPPATESAVKEQKDRELKSDNPFFFELHGENADMKYLIWDASLAAADVQIDRLLDELHIMTGIPSTAFGVTRQGNTNSGVSLERQMFATLQRVRRLRRRLEMAFAEVSGINNIEWVDNPFAMEA